MENDWKTLSAALEAHLENRRPGVYKSLRPALMNDAIRALEQRFKATLPPAVKMLYRWRDGQDMQAEEPFVNGYYFFPAEKMMTLFRQRAAGHCYPLFGAVQGAYPSYLCYDASGQYNGIKGSLFCHYPDEPFDEDIAGSMEAFIGKINAHYAREEKDNHFINFYGRKRTRKICGQ